MKKYSMNKILFYLVIASVANIAVAKDFSTENHGIQKAVMTKFANDNRAFEEYATLGKAQCYTKLFNLEEKYDHTSELFSNASITMYNERVPLLRLINGTSIQNSLVNYIRAKLTELTHSDKKSTTQSYYYRSAQSCETMFDTKNKQLRKTYLTLINNDKNYIQPDDNYTLEDIQQMENDYLKNYFIHVDIDGCPLGLAANC
ncbi:hypothetical protein [Acinetobacter sp. AS167]|uniref:hypothetical protein n=1 Tax=Acinetobacter sp. AS167 TaxID=3127884 RepID=UPI00301924EE